MRDLLDGILDTSIHFFLSSTPASQELLYHLVSVGAFECTPTYLVDRRSFDSYLLLIVRSGELYYQTRETSGAVRTGQVLLLDCHKPHLYFTYDRCSILFCHFDGGQSAQLVETIVERRGCVCTPEDEGAFIAPIEGFIDGLSQGHRLHEPTVSAQIYSMLMALYAAPEAHTFRVSEMRAINLAIEHILGHLDQPLTVDDVARQSGYSVSYFSRLFSQATGMSPHQYILRARMDRAKELLHATRLSIQTIAFETGYGSAASFSYTFRRVVGMSPTEYRNIPMYQ